MGRSRNNIATHGLSGKVGQFVYRQRSGLTVVAQIPAKSAKAPTAAQQAVKDRFTEAATYAKAAISDPGARAYYASKAKPRQSAYNLAFADYFKPPKIGEIDSSGYSGAIGSPIEVPVTDNGKVLSVLVRIMNAAGTLVEEGAAVLLSNGLHWRYTATASLPSLHGALITVSAKDMPGNQSSNTKTL